MFYLVTMSVAKIIKCQWYMNEIWARNSGVMKRQGNMKVLSEKPVPTLQEIHGMNNKNFTTIHQIYGEKFGSRIQTIFLGEILSSCDMDYGDNGISRHTVSCLCSGLALLLPPINTGVHNLFFTTLYMKLAYIPYSFLSYRCLNARIYFF